MKGRENNICKYCFVQKFRDIGRNSMLHYGWRDLRPFSCFSRSESMKERAKEFSNNAAMIADRYKNLKWYQF